MYLSVIFEEKPWQMGLRGDPYFWDDLKEYFSKIEFPYSEAQLIEDIYRIFVNTTGEHLTASSMPYVEKYAHGGMSSGGLSGKFWMKKGIPLLVERYRRCLETG